MTHTDASPRTPRDRVLLMTTDQSSGFSLFARSAGRRPGEPVDAGESATLECTLHQKAIFTYLKIGPDDRFSTLGPQGIIPHGDWKVWRLDEILIDGSPLPGSADEGPILDGILGVGKVVFMRVTNIGDAPAHFYAVWETEPVTDPEDARVD